MSVREYFRMRGVENNLRNYNERTEKERRQAEERRENANVEAFQTKVRNEASSPLLEKLSDLDTDIARREAQVNLMNDALQQIHIPLKAQGLSDGEILEQAAEQNRRISEAENEIKELKKQRKEVRRLLDEIDSDAWMQEQMKNYNPNSDYGAAAVIHEQDEAFRRRASAVIDGLTGVGNWIEGAAGSLFGEPSGRASGQSSSGGRLSGGQPAASQGGSAQASGSSGAASSGGQEQAAGAVPRQETEMTQVQVQDQAQAAANQANNQTQAQAAANQANNQAQTQAQGQAQGQAQAQAQGQAQAQAQGQSQGQKTELDNMRAAYECIQGKYANQDNNARKINLEREGFSFAVVQRIVNSYYRNNGNNASAAAAALWKDIIKKEREQGQRRQRSGWVKVNGEDVYLTGKKYEDWVRKEEEENQPNYARTLGGAFGAYFSNFMNGGIDPSGVSTSDRAMAEISERMAADRQRAAQQNMQIANRNYVDEANRLAAAQAAQKNAQVVSNIGNASAGAAALARGTEEADYQAQQARADEQRAQGVENQMRAGELRGTAEQARLEAKQRDWRARDLAKENRERQLLAMARGRKSTGEEPEPPPPEPDEDEEEEEDTQDVKTETETKVQPKPEERPKPDETQQTIVEALTRGPGNEPANAAEEEPVEEEPAETGPKRGDSVTYSDNEVVSIGASYRGDWSTGRKFYLLDNDPFDESGNVVPEKVVWLEEVSRDQKNLSSRYKVLDWDDDKLEHWLHQGLDRAVRDAFGRNKKTEDGWMRMSDGSYWVKPDNVTVVKAADGNSYAYPNSQKYSNPVDREWYRVDSGAEGSSQYRLVPVKGYVEEPAGLTGLFRNREKPPAYIESKRR